MLEHPPPSADSRAVEDLRWFLCDAAGSLGLKSSFPAMVARLEVGGRTGGRPIVEFDEHCLDSAARERPIRRAMAELKPAQRRVLFAAFGPGMRDLPAWKGLGAVVCLVTAALDAHRNSDRPLEEWLVRLSARALATPVSIDDRVLAGRIRDEARVLLAETCRAFAVERARQARRPRRYDYGC